MVFPGHSQELPVLKANRDYSEGRLDVVLVMKQPGPYLKTMDGIIDMYVLEGEVFNG